MASAWSVGMLFVLQFILGSALAPPEDCSSLPLLQVSFEDTTLSGCGTEGLKTLFRKVTSIGYKNVEAGETYTLVMVDPDAPNHGAGEAWLHWILSNVKASELQNGDIGNGNTVVEYKGPTPPKGTDTHRYFFYLYRESQKQLSGVDKRRKFVLQAYAELNKLSDPIAMNMFKTSF